MHIKERKEQMKSIHSGRNGKAEKIVSREMKMGRSTEPQEIGDILKKLSEGKYLPRKGE